jgi:hypothetical protein
MLADLGDYKMAVKNALHNLRLVEQVLANSVRIIERQATPAAPVATAEAIARERIAALEPNARLTEPEAAAWLHCSESLLRQWRWQGRGPAFEGTGKSVRYAKGVLDAFKANA